LVGEVDEGATGSAFRASVMRCLDERVLTREPFKPRTELALRETGAP
jgi:hypothetical protein